MPTSTVFAGLEQQADPGPLWLLGELLQAFKQKGEQHPHGHRGRSRGKRQDPAFSIQRQRCAGAGATTTERLSLTPAWMLQTESKNICVWTAGEDVVQLWGTQPMSRSS